MFNLALGSTSSVAYRVFSSNPPVERIDARIIGALSANSAAEAVNSTRSISVPKGESSLIAGTANVIPTSILSNWSCLRSSGLPEGAFGELVLAASSPQRAPNGTKRPLSEKALDAFLSVWGNVRDRAAEPVLSIDPTGGIVAEWFDTPENALVIMTNADGIVFYTLFSEGQPTEGFGLVDEVEARIESFLDLEANPFEWSDAHGR